METASSLMGPKLHGTAISSRRLSLPEARRAARRRLSAGTVALCGGIILLGWAWFFLYFQPGTTGTSLEKLPVDSRTLREMETRLESLSEEMLDPRSMVRQLRDQMTLAKSYMIIAKENENSQLAQALSLSIQTCERLFSRAAMEGQYLLDAEAEARIREMAILIFQAQELHYDSAALITKLKSRVQTLEDKASAAGTQSTFFGQLAAEAIPKSLHCLALGLTLEWGENPEVQSVTGLRNQSPKLVDDSLYHFAIFSDNVLAAAVAVNSTSRNMAEPERTVIHLVTDKMNYHVMQAWFFLNPPNLGALEIRYVEEFTWLNSSYCPALKQLEDAEMQSYYFKASMDDSKATLKFRNPKYLSMLNHIRFYIPEIFPKLSKIVFLDDDIVVQKDLSPLFHLDLNGNVNGAVETCLESFHRFHKYLNFSHPLIRGHFDPEACGWAFGMNVFDLTAWKQKNVTSIYHHWQIANHDRTLWRLGTLPPGLLTFYGLTQPLDRNWHVLGLGYDPNVDKDLVENAAVVHYNGNMKPWLKLALTQYRHLWSMYLNYSSPLLSRCNVH